MSISKFKINDTAISVVRGADEIWFLGAGVAKALGYIDGKNAIERHVPSDCKTSLEVLKKGTETVPFYGHPETVFISEPCVYALIFGSKLPSAQSYRKWVFSEVLPSIRRTGQYQSPSLRGNQFVMPSEDNLHQRVVRYIREH